MSSKWHGGIWKLYPFAFHYTPPFLSGLSYDWKIAFTVVDYRGGSYIHESYITEQIHTSTNNHSKCNKINQYLPCWYLTWQTNTTKLITWVHSFTHFWFIHTYNTFIIQYSFIRLTNYLAELQQIASDYKLYTINGKTILMSNFFISNPWFYHSHTFSRPKFRYFKVIHPYHKFYIYSLVLDPNSLATKFWLSVRSYGILSGIHHVRVLWAMSSLLNLKQFHYQYTDH